MKEDYVYKNCSIAMSTTQMANLMYAVIMCKAAIPSTFGIGIYGYTHVQNCRNRVEVVIHIHPCNIEKFESIAHVTLKNPQTAKTNSTP